MRQMVIDGNEFETFIIEKLLKKVVGPSGEFVVRFELK